MLKKLIHKLLGLSNKESGQYYGAKPPSRSLAKKADPSKKREKRKETPQVPERRKESPTSKPTERVYKKGHVKGNRTTQNNHSKQKSNINSRQQKVPFVPKVVPELPEIVEFEAEEGKKRFTELPIDKTILGALQDMEFKYCTPIQEECLPHTIAGKDITGKAQTGTGKTAAFLISAFQHMLSNPLENRLAGTPRVVVLAPTRELAIQIHKDAEALSKYTGFNNVVVFGGMNHDKQRAQLQHPIDILIGTPGRTIDYSRSGDLRLNKAEILVIDEADRMLDMGFMVDVRRIVAQLPKPGDRRTMFFSATFTDDITRLVDKWLVDPAEVAIHSDNKVADTIEQRFISVLGDEKFNYLVWLINAESIERMIIFGNRKDSNQRLCDKLRRYGVTTEVLSGDVPQKKRIKILEDFRAGKIKIIVATDVAARGIHVDNVSHVVNYDLPERAEDYVHRIGRTGRAGQEGKAVSLVCEYGAYLMEDIEETTGQSISCEHPTDEMVQAPQKASKKKKPEPQQPKEDVETNTTTPAETPVETNPETPVETPAAPKKKPSKKNKRKRFDTLDELAQAAAEKIVSSCKKSIKHHGLFSLALSGGSTPKPLFSLLASDEFKNEIEWDKVHIFWGDERCVEQSSDDSNLKTANELLLSHINIPEENIHSVNTTVGTSEEIAASYNEEIKSFFGQEGVPANFDMVLLGMGSDGHTASLFPTDEDGLANSTDLVTAIPAPTTAEPAVERVSITFPVINRAHEALLLVSGTEKLALVDEILSEPHNREHKYPVGRIKNTPRFIWYTCG